MCASAASRSGLDLAALSEPSPAATKGGDILLVEDDPTIAALLERLFRRAGRHVWIATSGTAGLETFATHRAGIAIALIDCQLPDLPGADLARRLRALAPGLPLLLTSGRDQQLLAASLALTGPTSFLPKPFLPGEIVAQVGRLARA